MTNYCPHCGLKNKPSAMTCRRCHLGLTRAATQPPATGLPAKDALARLEAPRKQSPEEQSHWKRALLARYPSIHRAIIEGDFPAVNSFIYQVGTDPDDRDDEESTPLYWAVFYGRADMAELLLRRGARVNAHSESGWTALHVACNSRKMEMVQLLLSWGADIHARNSNGETPLHGAVRDGAVEIIELLVREGADADAQDIYGSTPRSLALPEILACLEQALTKAVRERPKAPPHSEKTVPGRKEREFPSYESFKQFLEQNRERKFDHGTPYTCAMAIFTGRTVSEGHSPDVDINAPAWFIKFEDMTHRRGIWTGGSLLEVLKQINPEPFPKAQRKWRARGG